MPAGVPYRRGIAGGTPSDPETTPRLTDKVEGELAALTVQRAVCGGFPDCPPAGAPVEVDAVRHALVEDAGHRYPAVIVADHDDPAPAGAVLYAVALGPVCLLGYFIPGARPSPVSVVGRLPNGLCLAG